MLKCVRAEGLEPPTDRVYGYILLSRSHILKISVRPLGFEPRTPEV